MSQLPHRDPELMRLARAINKREELLQESATRINEQACSILNEAILQGQDLIKAKALVPHGCWDDWIHAHCPKTTQWAKYMRIAKHLPQMPELREAGSIRAALALLAVPETTDKKPKESKRWPGYIEAISKLSKFTTLISRHPLDTWPDEGHDKLKEELLPVARRLWPDKFAEGPAGATPPPGAGPSREAGRTGDHPRTVTPE